MGFWETAFRIAGAVVGSFLGGPIGSVIGSTIGSMIGGAIEPEEPKPDAPKFNTGILLNQRSTVAPVPVVYGSRRVGGAMVFTDTTGGKREFLHVVIVLSEGPVAAINTVYLDDIPITDKKYSGLVECYRHLGTDTEADSLLVSRSSLWTDDHKLMGFAYLYLRLKYDANVFTGLPTITADVDGRTLYDPRSRTTRFSSNPALVIRDYLTDTRYGKGLPVGVIQDESFAAAATHCEERAKIEGGGTSPVQCTVKMGEIFLEVEDASLFAIDDWVSFSSDADLPIPLRKPLTRIASKKGNRLTLSEIKTVYDPYDPDAPGVDTWVPAAIKSHWVANSITYDVDLPVSGIITKYVNHSVYCGFTVGQNNTLRLATAPPFRSGDGVRFKSTRSLPAPLQANVTYYAIVGPGETFGVADSIENALSGNGIPVTNAGTGIISVMYYDNPQYACNGVLNTDASLIDNLNALLTSCRGILVWSAGYYKLLIDRATASTFAFTPDNITQSWTIDTGEHTARANRISCTWFNPANKWQQDLLTVDALPFRAADKGFLVEKTVELPFTADGHMANRICWSMLKQLRLGLSVEFTATMDALQVEVGDVVSITHPTPGWSAKLFRVTKLLLLENDEVKVTAREYHPDAYVADTTATFNPGPSVTLPDPHRVAAPSGIAVIESLYATRSGTGAAKAKATISWNGSDDAYVVMYQLSVRRSADTVWKIIAQTPDTTFDWMDITPGRYGFRVRAINTLGIESDYTEAFCEIYGLSAPPSDLTGLAVAGLGGMALLSWDLSPDLDVRFGGSVLIQYSPAQSGATWARSTSACGPVPGNATSAILPLRAGTYMARFVDSSGVQSATYASVVVTQSMVWHYADTSTLLFHPDFSGQKTNCQADANTLRLTGALLVDDWIDVDSLLDVDYAGGVAEHAEYLPGQIMDFEVVVNRRFTSSLVTEIYSATDLLDLRADNIDTWQDVDGQRFSGVDAVVEISTTDDDPEGAPLWGGWSRLDVQEMHARAARFRLVITSDGFFNISVSEFSITASGLSS
ncbi:MAG: phage tail protein [Magnetococcus sp. DMHC-8]